MSQITFSFIILTWNRSAMLSICLQQLLQSITNKTSAEIIVMDNGSTDDTQLVLDLYKKDPMFRIYRRDKNYGLNAFKQLIGKTKGKYVVMIDEDVLQFPGALDTIFQQYFSLFPDYGFMALDVIQNEHTNGAKPPESTYTNDTRNGLVVQRGPTGAWCSCFRKKDFTKIRLLFNLINISMKRSQDTTISFFFRNVLRLKHGIIKGQKCLHANGPYYAKEFGYLSMQTEKYRQAGYKEITEMFSQYK